MNISLADCFAYSIFPGKVDPINDQDPEANLKKAFTKFSEDLGVVPLLEPKDLLGDDIDEELVLPGL